MRMDSTHIPTDSLSFMLSFQILDMVRTWVGARAGGDLRPFVETLVRHLDLSALPTESRDELVSMLTRCVGIVFVYVFFTCVCVCLLICTGVPNVGMSPFQCSLGVFLGVSKESTQIPAEALYVCGRACWFMGDWRMEASAVSFAALQCPCLHFARSPLAIRTHTHAHKHIPMRPPTAAYRRTFPRGSPAHKGRIRNGGAPSLCTSCAPPLLRIPPHKTAKTSEWNR